jgi:hypothetical protein
MSDNSGEDFFDHCELSKDEVSDDSSKKINCLKKIKVKNKKKKKKKMC